MGILSDPTQYKNKNQYSAIARNELYNQKRNKDEKILNPNTIPQKDMVTLGRIIDQENNVKKEMESSYLTEQQRYDLRMKQARLNNEKLKMIKGIKQKEMQYYRSDIGSQSSELTYGTGGKHLLKDELILSDPTQYKNK